MKRTRSLLAFTVLLELLMGIGSMSSQAAIGNSSTATDMPTEAATQATTGVSVAMKLQGADGITIAATFYASAYPPAPALLLLHQTPGQKEDLTQAASAWNGRGYNVLAIDMRGHGETGGVEDWKKTVDDIQLVLAQLAKLPGVDGSRIGIVGGSMGGQEGLVACAKFADCQALVLLSPGRGFAASIFPDPMQALGKRPVFIAVAKGNEPFYSTDKNFDSQAQGEHEFVTYDGSAHALQLFQAHPELVDKIGEWLIRYLPVQRPATAVATGTP